MQNRFSDTFSDKSRIACALLASCLFSSSLAAEAVLEEIVVTADFYDAPMLSSPGSIGIVSARTIRDREARHIEDVLNTVANVGYSKGASRTRFVQVRGIGDRGAN